MKSAIDIVKRALSILRVYAKEQPLQAVDRNNAIERLNDMVNHWQVQYNHLWLFQEAVVLLEQGATRYKLGTDRAIDADELNVTTVATDTTTTALDVSAAGNIAVNDYIGVELDTGVFHWTAVAAISGTSITLASAVPSIASAGNTVYAYTSVIDRPLRVSQARYAYEYGGSEVPCEIWSRQEYFEQPDKATQGSVTNVYYSPQLTDGLLYVWPTAQATKGVLNITVTRKFNLTTNNADTIDFPDEWAATVAYGLAAELADEYGVPDNVKAAVVQKSRELLSANLAFDNDGLGLVVEIDRGY